MVGIAMGEPSAAGLLLMIGNGAQCRDVCGTEKRARHNRQFTGMETFLDSYVILIQLPTYDRTLPELPTTPPEEKAMPARVSIPTVRA